MKKRLAITIGTIVSLMTGDAWAAPDALPECAAALAYSESKNGVAVLVLKNGRIVCASPQPDAAHELWSGTKSLVGLMAAAAVQDGLLTLDERAAETITEWRNDPQKGKITLRQLLSMTSGHPPAVGRPLGYAASLHVGLSAEPGTRFQYGPTPLQIFGEVMRRKLEAAGHDPDPCRYLEHRILAPIGAHVADWRTGPDGHPLMPQGAVMSAKQWAKIGEFVRGGGMHEGKILVDDAAFRALFIGSSANPAYGLTWWLPRATSATDVVTASTDITSPGANLPEDMVVAAGAGDQRLYVIPSQGLTIVRQARLDLSALMSGRKSGWSDSHFLSLILTP
ncbi:serine hydrolase domain-containing protein [Sphingopyxis alaskensis]|uniref:serine hydrolase domain-containing protein n=1 Tax=Sphingopyxis alaskensis TaxID=117207 RepID=UPI001991E949|nr:serine hydrolase domain-containing protein [Sphingopyxis alaskensis]MBD3744963.1 beta-lactamase family protein [Sphingopyxis terrae]MCM3420178.1 beta-lactamase family protein [Sphingopyxis alaskensis]